MLRSLRFRLPAIFLLGMLVAALVTAAIAVRFFQDDTRSRTLAELRRQAEGLAELYTLQAASGVDEGLQAPRFAPPTLEEATGSQLFYAGVEIFPGQASGLETLPLSLLDEEALNAGRGQTFEFHPRGGSARTSPRPSRSGSAARRSAQSSSPSRARSSRSGGST